MEYWLHIKVLGKSVICLKLSEGNNLCFEGKYLIKKLVLEVPTSESAKIIFDVSIRQGENTSSTLINNQKIILKKNRSFLQLIDNIICGFSSKQEISIDLMITKTQTGINLGMMSPKYEATHIAINLTSDKINLSPEEKIDSKISSREVFISNIESFAFAIEKTYIDTFADIETQHKEWVKAISSISNSDSLMAVYNTCEKDMAIWKNVIESWGIKFDKCTKYPYCVINKDFYSIPEDANNDSFLIVTKPSCTLWVEEPDGHKQEKVIVKGQVKLC